MMGVALRARNLVRAPDGKLWLWGTLRVEIIQKLFFIGSVLRTEIFQNLFKIKQNLLGEAPDGTSFIAARFAWKLIKN